MRPHLLVRIKRLLEISLQADLYHSSEVLTKTASAEFAKKYPNLLTALNAIMEMEEHDLENNIPQTHPTEKTETTRNT